MKEKEKEKEPHLVEKANVNSMKLSWMVKTVKREKDFKTDIFYIY